MAESTTAGNMEGGYTNTGAKPGPVLMMMSKRLRALRKKYTKIMQIEEAKNQGKVVNKEQEDVLKSKFSVATLIDEYEKLQKPLEAAVKDELLEREKDLAAAAAIQRSAVSAAAATSEENSDTTENKEAVEVKSSSGVADCSSPAEEKINGTSHEDIADLLKLLYFAHLFDVRSQGEAHSLVWTKEYERSSCISYDYVTEEAETPLGEPDLDAIAALGTLLTSRPPNVTLSHKDALQRCVEHARNWLNGSNEEIGEGSKLSYDQLRERLNKILSSDYFTVTPELQTAAAAAGQYVGEGNIEIVPQAVVPVEEPPTYYSPQEQAGPPLQFYQQHADYLAGGQPHSFSNDVQGDYAAADSVEYAVVEEAQQDGQLSDGGAHFQQQPQMMSPHLAGQPQQGGPPPMMSVPHQMMGGPPQYMSGGPGPRGGGMGGGPRGGRGGYRGRGGGYDGNRGGRRGGMRGSGRGMQGNMQYYEPQGYAGGMGGARGSGRGHRGMRGGRGGGPAGGPE